MTNTTERIIAIAKMFGKGRIQVPKEAREALKLKDGDSIYFIENLRGRITIKKVPKLERAKVGRYTITERQQ